MGVIGIGQLVLGIGSIRTGRLICCLEKKIRHFLRLLIHFLTAYNGSSWGPGHNCFRSFQFVQIKVVCIVVCEINGYVHGFLDVGQGTGQSLIVILMGKILINPAEEAAALSCFNIFQSILRTHTVGSHIHIRRLIEKLCIFIGGIAVVSGLVRQDYRLHYRLEGIDLLHGIPVFNHCIGTKHSIACQLTDLLPNGSANTKGCRRHNTIPNRITHMGCHFLRRHISGENRQNLRFRHHSGSDL